MWLLGRPGRFVALCSVFGLLIASVSPAGSTDDVRLEPVGYHDLGGGGLHGDVWLHRGIAYVGTTVKRTDRERGCPGTGVKLLDLADPANPVLIGTLAEHPHTRAEQVRVRSVDTPAFRGDLLAVGLQTCLRATPENPPIGLRGLELWDVTDPRAPGRLGFFEVMPDGVLFGGGVHELDLVQRADGRVLALLAVPDSEISHPEQLGDFRVVDATDPRAPSQLAAWGVVAGAGLPTPPAGGQGLDADVWGHSVRAGADGTRAFVSYWDGGVFILDLADPADPRLLGRTTFAADEEGNAHSVELAQGGRVLIQADEVFDIKTAAIRVESPPELAGLIAAEGDLPAGPWAGTTSVTAELAYLGRGCPAGDPTAEADSALAGPVADDPYPSDPSGRIAVLELGTCPVAAKLERAHAAGAVGAIVVNEEDAAFAPGARVEGQLSAFALASLPGMDVVRHDPAELDTSLGAFGIARAEGERLKAALAAGGSVTVTLAADLSKYQDFGRLHIWDVADPSLPSEIATFRTPRSRVDVAQGPSEPGVFTAHNAIVLGDLMLVSWYTDGVLAVDIRDPAAPRALTAWVPPMTPAPNAVTFFEGDFPSIWGIAVDGDLVVVSDINRGLYVLRLVR